MAWLLILAFGLGFGAPDMVIPLGVVMLLGIAAGSICVQGPAALWNHHRRKSIAVVIFLGGLFSGFGYSGHPATPEATSTKSLPMHFTQHQICRPDVSNCRTFILAQGEIVKETPAEFETLVRRMRADQVADQVSDTDIVVFFDSIGGGVQPGVELGELIRRYHLITYVGGPYEETSLAGASPQTVQLLDHGKCLSACVYAFAGGERRIYREPGVIGVHQFYGGNDESTAQATMVRLGQYLDQVGVDRRLLDLGAVVSPQEMKTVTLAQAREWHLDTTEPPKPQEPQEPQEPQASQAPAYSCPQGYGIVGDDGFCQKPTGDGRMTEFRSGTWYYPGTDEKATVLIYGRILEQREDGWYYQDTGEKWIAPKKEQ
jgi:hypothetical protein